MMRSLFSGVSGLKVHQTKMDVIGNNIANVNTVGFKSSSVNFSDVFYQTTQSATGPNANTGAAGKNAMQIGLGANVASITANITGTGGSQRTDNPLDIMINGDAFFIVNNGGTNYFTKAGAFNVDAGGTLCTSSGATVMGWQVDKTTGNIIQDVVSPLRIMSAENLYSEPEATTAAFLAGNIDRFSTSVSSTGNGYPIQIGVYDKMGNQYNMKFTLRQESSTNYNEYNVYLEDIEDINGVSILSTKTGATYGPATGVSLSVDGAAAAFTIDTATGEPIDFGTQIATVMFDPASGKFATVGAGSTVPAMPAVTPKNEIKLGITTPTNNFSTTGIDIDFSSLTMFANGGNTNIESAKGDLEGQGKGRRVGNMTGIKVDSAGKIYGTYDNGDSKLLGQIAVTTFANPSGLEAVGNNMFAQTKNSGEFDGIGQDPTTGGASLTTGVLEMSNVDLSSEFTSMITTQRGFQANSRIITTSDTLLEELINLKR